MRYDDGRIACDDTSLLIRRYYGIAPKRIPYSSIVGVRRRPLTRWRGRWRIWGSGDFKHWYNFDAGRTKKAVALDIDTGGWVVPTITPDDPDAVERILAEQAARSR